jgi:hypothetical protein
VANISGCIGYAPSTEKNFRFFAKSMRLIDPFFFLAEWSDILRKADSPSLERVADNRADVTRMEQLNRYDG